MVLQLAEREYGDPYLFEDMMMGRFTSPITVGATQGRRTSSTCRRSSRRAPARNVVLRGASIQLVALLESGDLDCAFEYESVARQHGLRVRARCRPPIDLGEAGRRDGYRRVEVKLDFRRFASVRPVFRGDVIRYAFTIPANAPDAGAGRASSSPSCSGRTGARILEADHQPLLTPPVLDDAAAAPEEVRRACAGSR